MSLKTTQTISQFGFQFIIIVLISTIVWVLTSMTLLSLPAILTGGGFLIPNSPFFESATWGLVAGIAHGLLAAIMIFWYKPSSWIGTSVSSILATEILIAVGFIVGFVINYLDRPVQPNGPRIALTYENFYVLIVTFVFWFVILSVVLLIPSIVIGLADKPFVSNSNLK